MTGDDVANSSFAVVMSTFADAPSTVSPAVDIQGKNDVRLVVFVSVFVMEVWRLSFSFILESVGGGSRSVDGADWG